MKKANMGVGLVEVLVSLLILSVGLLGLLGLQTKVMQFNQGALYQTRATVLAKDMMDRMRANRSQVGLYVSGFDATITAFVDCQSNSCNSEQMADYDLAEWRSDIARVLPDGQGEISTIGGPTNAIYIVTLQYDDSRSVGATKFGQDNTATPKQFRFRTVL